MPPLLKLAMSLLALAGGNTAAIAAAAITTVTYACADGKTVFATYYPGAVDIILSDGRSMALPQTMSGSGTRFAKLDESVVFWSKGNDAFITEGDPDTPTFADCVGQNDG